MEAASANLVRRRLSCLTAVGSPAHAQLGMRSCHVHDLPVETLGSVCCQFVHGVIIVGRPLLQTPVVMELGGKDPFIVCDDADYDQALSTGLRGAFQSCGQNCTGAERFFIHSKHYEARAAATCCDAEGLVGPAGPAWGRVGTRCHTVGLLLMCTRTSRDISTWSLSHVVDPSRDLSTLSPCRRGGWRTQGRWPAACGRARRWEAGRWMPARCVCRAWPRRSRDWWTTRWPRGRGWWRAGFSRRGPRACSTRPPSSRTWTAA